MSDDYGIETVNFRENEPKKEEPKKEEAKKEEVKASPPKEEAKKPAAQIDSMSKPAPTTKDGEVVDEDNIYGAP